MVQFIEQFTDDKEMPLLNSEQFCLLSEVSAEDPDFLNDLLSTFLIEAKPAVERLCSACESHDDDEILRLVHFLAGSSANLGLMRFPEICRKIETSINEGASIDYVMTPDFLARELELSAEHYSKIIKARA